MSAIKLFIQGPCAVHNPGLPVDLPDTSRYLCRHWLQRRLAMTTFDRREEGFERKFALDEELKFRAEARRNRLLGLWAAEKFGLSGTEADAYAKAIIHADIQEAGEEDVFRKLRADFDARK